MNTSGPSRVLVACQKASDRHAKARSMTEWITSALAQMGYLGIVLLMVAENVFPPIPSELVMSFAGFTAARGELNIGGVIVAGTLGSVIGSLPWYFGGRVLGQQRLEQWASRHGRWLTMSPQEVRSATLWFRGTVENLCCLGA
jgi:membrane protein DedA with SNARE-associated domain